MPLPPLRSQKVDLRTPPGMKYECVNCGIGCREFSEIPVDDAAFERLSKLDLEKVQQGAPGQPPFVPDRKDPTKRVLCHTGEACVFLTPTRLCGLHREYGPENKPQACIDFPFRFVDTPAGTFVGVSFVCTAILEEHGTPVEDRRNELLRGLPHTTHRTQAAERPRLTKRVSIDFDAYMELEAALDEVLLLPNIELGPRLLCQSILLDLVVRTFEAARLDDPGGKGPSLSPAEREAARAATDVELVRSLTQRFRADRWGRLLLQANAAPPSMALHRAFVGLVTSFRAALVPHRSRWAAMWSIATGYVAHASRLGRIHLLPLPLPFHYRAFESVAVDMLPGSYLDHSLTRYFRHVLFRKDLLLADTLRTGHRLMLLHFALVRWYVVGMSALQGKDAPDTQLMREALRHVEKLYVHHSAFSRFLEEQPVLGSLVDSVLMNKRYAASMIHPPVKRKSRR